MKGVMRNEAVNKFFTVMMTKYHEREELQEMGVDRLMSIARDNGLQFDPKATRADMLRLIFQHQKNVTKFTYAGLSKTLVTSASSALALER